ncbi:MAG: polysaccharide deacetylase family protein [Candidatus Omnitrophica bacterium]|nr:polysaccharide deacetylase family protein [Candidatus Omnitrophota bacterium]
MKKIHVSLVMEIPYFALSGAGLRPGAIPSFIMHKVEPEDFSELLDYLKRNGYRTLGIKEYYEYLSGKKHDKDKKIIITFDDGLRNNWSVVYPILKKFSMKAVFYVNPEKIMESGQARYNLEDVWQSKISHSELDIIEEKEMFINWEEARKMQKSGIIDIESHSLFHQLCFTKNKIIDFQRPGKDGNSVYPWLFSAMDLGSEDSIWGAPVYPFSSRMIAKRFYDDAGLRQACIDFVKENQGIAFFSIKNWKNKLINFVKDYSKANELKTYFESDLESEINIRDSLLNSKLLIEQKLDKACEHFAYPWNISGDLSLLWLKELGFKTVFRFMNGWNIPKRGCDLYGLSRVEGYWIKSLPGKGRKIIWDKLLSRITRLGF